MSVHVDAVCASAVREIVVPSPLRALVCASQCVLCMPLTTTRTRTQKTTPGPAPAPAATIKTRILLSCAMPCCVPAVWSSARRGNLDECLYVRVFEVPWTVVSMKTRKNSKKRWECVRSTTALFVMFFVISAVNVYHSRMTNAVAGNVCTILMETVFAVSEQHFKEIIFSRLCEHQKPNFLFYKDSLLAFGFRCHFTYTSVNTVCNVYARHRRSFNVLNFNSKNNIQIIWMARKKNDFSSPRTFSAVSSIFLILLYFSCFWQHVFG